MTAKHVLRGARRIGALAFYVLLLVGPAAAGEGTPPIWKAQIGSAQVTLFGSVHFLPRGLDWEPEELDAAFEEADEVVFEIPTDGRAQIEIVTAMARHGYYPPGMSLPDTYSEDEWSDIVAAARSVGLSPADIERTKPWLATIMISTQFILAQGLEPGSGVDAVLTERATRAGKNLGAFETPTEQIELFSTLAPETQKTMLLQTVAEIDTTGAYLQSITDAWLAGDISALVDLLHGPMREQKEVQEAILLARNHRWADSVAAWADRSDDILVVVGVAHLVGEENVPDLLRAKGFTVEGPHPED